MPIGRKQSNGFFEMTLPREATFSFEFVGDLNERIPSVYRSFDDITQVWQIKNRYYDDVRLIYEKYFGVPNHDLFEG
ncbi:MAG: hypothetical protein GF364_22610 [Candidatus Lokiarchaeota archaeon]|nr:hypothetical protein [Candidatus Lokiarchaeota archaeon]